MIIQIKKTLSSISLKKKIKRIILNEILIFFLTLIFSISCQNDSIQLNIGMDGDFYDERIVKENYILMVESGSYVYASKILIDEIPFLIVENESRQVIYIKTFSEIFKTSESVMIGDDISKCIKNSENGVFVDFGLNYLIKLNSGWYANVGSIEIDTEEILIKGKVQSFYKKNINLSCIVSIDEWKKILIIEKLYNIGSDEFNPDGWRNSYNNQINMILKVLE